MLKKAIKWFLSSLDTSTTGGSARKLTAFLFSLCTAYIELVWIDWAKNHNDFSVLFTVITANFGFISLLLGLTTYQYLKQDKKELVEPPKPDTPNKEDVG